MQKWPRAPLDGGEGDHGGSKALRTVANKRAKY